MKMKANCSNLQREETYEDIYQSWSMCSSRYHSTCAHTGSVEAVDAAENFLWSDAGLTKSPWHMTPPGSSFGLSRTRENA